MADELRQQAILTFTVDQGQAVKDLEKAESAILDLKKEQANLNKEYKAGKISQTEYVRENLKLQQSLKKETDQKRTLNKLIETESNSRNAIKARISELVKEYDNLNTATAEGAKREKQLADELRNLNTQITKTSKDAGLFKDQIGNYPQAFQQAASQIRVAGVSVGDLGTRLASFANPATAAVGIITALGAAYARSTVGAKDLAFAQAQLSAATTLITNGFGELISSAEDGEGALTKLLNIALQFSVLGLTDALGLTNIVDGSRNLALLAEQLEDLGREELQIRAEVSDRLEQNQELLTIIGDEQADINEKIAASNTINDNLLANQRQLVDVKERQLNIITQQLAADENNEDLQTQQLEKIREISKIQADTEKKIQANVRVQDDLNRALAEELRLRQLVSELEERRRTGADTGLTDINAGALGVATEDPNNTVSDPERTADLIEGNAELQINAREKLNADLLKLDKKAGEEEIRNKNAVAQAKIAAEESTLRATAQIAGEASELFAESTAAYKILASAQTLISTYTAAQKAFEALAGIPFVGPALGGAAAAVAIAQGLQRVATINGVGFAEGGWTGPGNKYDAVGVVHADEYVTPKRVVNNPSAKPHLNALERMRTGYADGGFVTTSNTAGAQQSLLMMNAMRMLPPPVVAVKEITTVQNRINVRERQSKR
jgi:hypothetical protein